MMATKMMDQTSSSESGFRLKGWHVLAIIVGFFVVVFAVNFAMAYFAIETFSGMQTEKPYENGLAFNREIARANAQNALDWHVSDEIDRADDGVVTIKSLFTDHKNLALGGLDVMVTLKAPVDARRDHMIPLDDRGGGHYEGKAATPAGQWDVETVAKQNGDVIYRSVNRVVLQ